MNWINTSFNELKSAFWCKMATNEFYVRIYSFSPGSFLNFTIIEFENV